MKCPKNKGSNGSNESKGSMPVFISYNHQDEEFVEKLARALVHQNVPVWRDKWMMKLGDPITGTIQDALEKATFVCIVLSENSLKSKWVEREITASLVRELEEGKLSILPLVIDDCTLPLFLRDKVYADFRQDFEGGVRMILNAVADTYNIHSGKITNEGKITCFGTDVWLYKERIEIDFDIISQDNDHNYFILTKVHFIGNKGALEQFKLYREKGQENAFIREVVGVCGQLPEFQRKKVKVGGRKGAREELVFDNQEHGLSFRVKITSKKVGDDDGKYVVFDLGSLLRFFTQEK